MTPIKEITRGRWLYLLPGFGIDAAFLTGRHGPCPLCKAGTDRWRFDDKDAGMWFCSQCGSGDGTALVMRVTGLDFKEAIAEIQKRVQGAPQPAKQRPARTDEDKRRAMGALWAEGRQITPGDVVWRYLTGRGIPATLVEGLREVRFVPAARFYPDPKDRSRHVILPAMIAKVRAPDGTPINLHRTYLTERAEKAPYEDCRKLMHGSLPRGAAVMLAPPMGNAEQMVLGVAEGIETALSARAMFSSPVWALINADNLAAWEPPAGVTDVPVFGDADENYVGQAAAYALARRLVVSRKIGAQVFIPPGLGTDWNDRLREGAQVA